MNNFKHLYKKGVNLGGWISQYDKRKKIGDPHFDSFITEKDIAQIAGFKLDHVRLPVDYMVFESDDNPGVYDEAGLAYIDKCIGWCKKYKLNLLLDMHHVPGFSFFGGDSNSLFTDKDMQQRMINIWVNFAKRYIDEGENLAFELLNEIVEPDSTRWNALAGKIVEAIREIDKERVILIGGNHYNAVSALKDIAIIPNDDNIVYNFHFYEPMLLTHQLASWNKMNMDYGLNTSYPGVFPKVAEFIEKYPQHSYLKRFIDHYVDVEHLKNDLKPALEFIKNTGKTIYCGEYGVIELADSESRRNWHRDFNKLMDEYEIGRAVWSYKLMSFSFVDRDSNVVDSELWDIIAGQY